MDWDPSFFESAHQILPRLYLGEEAAAQDASFLEEKGVTHIVQCNSAESTPSPEFYEKYKYFRFAALDVDSYNIQLHFEGANKFISEALADENSVVLVHCLAGVSRSATIVTAYIMASMRLDASTALTLVQRSRKIAQPNYGFVRQLQTFGQSRPSVTLGIDPIDPSVNINLPHEQMINLLSVSYRKAAEWGPNARVRSWPFLPKFPNDQGGSNDSDTEEGVY